MALEKLEVSHGTERKLGNVVSLTFAQQRRKDGSPNVESVWKKEPESSNRVMKHRSPCSWENGTSEILGAVKPCLVNSQCSCCPPDVM